MEWSASGRHTSRMDIHLTGRGRAQALDATHGRGLALDPSTVSILGWEREVPVIRLRNDDSHLTAGDALSDRDLG
jgi:broad specificity phosphatase PhoE